MSLKRISSYGFLTVAMLLWALSFIWYKEAYQWFSPMLTVLLRLGISAIPLLIVLFIRRNISFNLPTIAQFLPLALFEPFLYFLGEGYGMKYVSSTTGAVIVSTIPLFSMLTGYFFLKEKLRAINFTGFFISFAGVVLVVLTSGGGLSATLKGVLLMLLAVFSAVGYVTQLGKLANKYDPITILTFQNTLGFVFFIPVVLIFEPGPLMAVPKNAIHLVPVLKLSLLASTLAFIFFISAIRYVGVARGNAFVNLVPVFTSLFALWMLGEKLSAPKIVGIILVITGLFLSQVRRKMQQDPI